MMVMTRSRCTLGLLISLAAAGCGKKADDATPPAKTERPAPDPARQEAQKRATEDAIQKQEAAAEAERKRALDEAAAAQATIDDTAKQLEAFNLRVAKATDALAGAKSEAERTAAMKELQELQRERAEMEAKVAASKAEALKAARAKGVKISKECQDNPLAKGCS